VKTTYYAPKPLIWTRLQRKIFALVVSLFTLVFALTLISINQAAYNQAEREFIARLLVGKNVFLNEINIAKVHLDSSVETIAKDWALRSAIGQGDDVDLINSVLFNHGQRIDADIALILDKQFMLIAQYGSEDVTVDKFLAQNLNDSQKQQAWITMVGSEPFLVSAEPVRAPATIGWLIMGKKINQSFLQRIKTLISLDINLAVLSQQQARFVLATNNNAPQISEELLKLTVPDSENLLTSDTASMLETGDVVALPFQLATDSSSRFVVVLQDSISVWLHARNLFMLELLPFFIVGILLALFGSFFIARSITRPVGRLLTAAKLIASGQYDQRINVSERSELGELAKAFSNMQRAVMEREQKITDQAEEIKQTNKIKYQIDIARKEQQLAAEATNVKSRFLANVSHEIRTPLHSIIGYSEMLNDPDVSQQQKQAASQAINNGGQYLLNIVNDVLDLSKIEAGKIQLYKIDSNLIALLKEVESYMQGFAHEKKLAFNLKLHFPLPQFIKTDPTRLKQILLNLCNNAIKFTAKGQVDLLVYLDSQKQRCIFVVSDTGPGMSDEQQLRLFTAFSQGNQASNRQYGGTGLGLYISKQLTELLGGHIKVTSQEKLGSQFAVYLPCLGAADDTLLTGMHDLPETMALPSQTAVNVPQLDAHVLCVDDNDDNRRLVAYLLEKTGAVTTLAANGKEALALASLHSFDLILMDMQMPEMDGLQATQQLIAQGFIGPIVMLTANNDQVSISQTLQAGASEHLAKPIDTAAFYAMLNTYLGARSYQQAPLASQKFTQLTLLYVASFSEKIKAMQHAMSQQDWPQLKLQMHKIKGSAGSYGFQAISEIATHIESLLDQQQFQSVNQQLNAMCQLMRQANAARELSVERLTE